MPQDYMKETALDLAKLLYASIRRGDTDFVLNLFADEAVINGPAASNQVHSWGVSYRGRDGVLQFFAMFGRVLDVEQLDIIDFIAEAEKVAVIGYIAGTTITDHAKFANHFVHIIRVDKNRQKIIELRLFSDPAAPAGTIR